MFKRIFSFMLAIFITLYSVSPSFASSDPSYSLTLDVTRAYYKTSGSYNWSSVSVSDGLISLTNSYANGLRIYCSEFPPSSSIFGNYLIFRGSDNLGDSLSFNIPYAGGSPISGITMEFTTFDVPDDLKNGLCDTIYSCRIPSIDSYDENPSSWCIFFDNRTNGTLYFSTFTYSTSPYSPPQPGFDEVGGWLWQLIQEIIGFFTGDENHNDEIDQAVSDLEDQDQQMGQVEDQYLDDFHEQQSDMAGIVSTFQWPSGITSAMAWITIQMNSIWSGLGGDVQMLFTFSMILGLSLIFLGRWKS